MKRILFVDDDPNVRQGLKRMLYSMRLDWEIEFAESGSQGLELMRHKSYDALVCDMRMPGLSGLDTLKIVSELYPQTIRFVLSGMVDHETSLQVTEFAHQFLTKPCEAKVLISTLQRAFAVGGSINQDGLKKLISRLKKLPSLPSLYTNIIEEIQSPQTSLERIGAIIERDPSMCAKVLQLVNSAFFGMKQNIVDPIQATSFLGVDIIKDLVLSINVFSQFNPQLIRRLGIGALWDHSTLVGVYAKTIAKAESQTKDILGFAFTAGVLHDIGKLVLAENMPAEYASALRTSARNGVALYETEKEIFGATHAQVGAYLLGIWGLAASVVEAIEYHHTPMEIPGTSFSAATSVYAANTIDHRLHTRSWARKKQGIQLEYLEKLGLKDHYSQWETSCQAIP